MRVTWYTAMSMDGRIAGAGDDMDFLSSIDGTGEVLPGPRPNPALASTMATG